MHPEHTNPSRPDHVASAPYNFVPLPERVVTVDETEIPGHDRYVHYTGHIDCTLVTETPTYTRVAMNPEFFARWAERLDDLNKNKDAREEYAQFFTLDDARRPVIPGSTLRGMIRALIEIAGYGKMQWVAREPTITFRAVAAPDDDPLQDPYQRALGRFGRNVQVGYLAKTRDGWQIRPAKRPVDVGLRAKKAFLTIKDSEIRPGDIPGLRRFSDPKYLPQYHPVGFDVGRTRSGQLQVTRVGAPGNGQSFAHNGVLVCTGNMLETAAPEQESPRKNYALVLEENPRAAPVPIPERVIQDYLAGLTAFQRSEPFDKDLGCLKKAQPVFYIEERGEDGRSEVVAFGHTPNFRIPAWLHGTRQAATPLDFVPEAVRRETEIDLAEAIFGYTPKGEGTKGRAGRVFFGDAVCDPGQRDVWFSPKPITPPILSSPKPTTFQHYLVQDKSKGHDPDDRKTLAHYGTPTPEETVIRGHKLYWHRQDFQNAAIVESQPVDWQENTQHTQIKPVKPGVRFSFRICFENLRDFELGALLWALMLPGATGRTYRHKLGMGKPLGMGSVQITSNLVLGDRAERYRRLFSSGTWHEPEREDRDPGRFFDAFERYVLGRMDPAERGTTTSLSQLRRIQMLLRLLEWPGQPSTVTRYLKIDANDTNEYAERPVLPDPIGIRPPSVRGGRGGSGTGGLGGSSGRPDGGAKGKGRRKHHR